MKLSFSLFVAAISSTTTQAFVPSSPAFNVQRQVRSPKFAGEVASTTELNLFGKLLGKNKINKKATVEDGKISEEEVRALFYL